MNRDFILLTLGGASFGTAAIFVELCSLTPAATAFFRFLLAGIILVALKGRPKYLKKVLPYSLLLGIHMFLFIESVKLTQIIDATVLVSTSPIYVLLLARLMKVKVYPIDVVAAVMAVIGVTIMNYPLIMGQLIGNLVAIGSAFATAIYTILLNRRSWDAEPLVLTSNIYLVASLVILPLTLVQGFGTFNLTSWLAVGGLVALPTLVGHSTVIYLSKRIRPQVIDTFTLLEPVVATSLAYLIFRQVPNSHQLIGSSLVLLSLLVLILKS
jgi:drug/metabolite transporter (DMT)-like permease